MSVPALTGDVLNGECSTDLTSDKSPLTRSSTNAMFTWRAVTDLLTVYYTHLTLGPKVGQIGPKWYKSGAFSDNISAQSKFGPKWVRLSPNVINPGLFQIRFPYFLALN